MKVKKNSVHTNICTTVCSKHNANEGQIFPSSYFLGSNVHYKSNESSGHKTPMRVIEL